MINLRCGAVHVAVSAVVGVCCITCAAWTCSDTVSDQLGLLGHLLFRIVASSFLAFATRF